MNLLEIAPNQLCEILRTDPQKGLSSLAVLQNRKEFGENVPPDSLFNPKSVCKSLFSNVLFCMFLALSIFSLFTENRVVATVCLSVSTVCYVVFYLYCMYKARPLSQAKRKVEGTYAVLRGGRRVQVRSREIVPGDLLLCRRGDCIPCDGILLAARDVKVCQVQIDSRASSSKCSWDEAQAEGKQSERAILYCSSVMLSGEGVLLVCNTGKNIRKNSLSCRQRGYLPRPIAAAGDLARKMSLWLCCAATVLFLAGTFLGVDAYSNFFLLCSISAAVLPELAESLTRLMMTMELAQLKSRGALVKNYACLDALLDTDRILVDSAAYFLDAQIRPSTYFYANCPRSVREVSEGLFTLISYSRLCCEDKPKRKAQMWYGKSSIDAAICRTAPEFGIDAEYLSHSYLTVNRAPFAEERGFSAALILEHERCYQIIRGRPTDVLDRCTHSLHEKRSTPLSTAAKARLYQAADQLAAAGEVVVAIARRYWRSVPADLDPADAGYMTFVGFLTFHTPMRAESAEAVAACRKDGVRVLLCTDNDPDATLGIARNMEFFPEQEEPYVLTGEKARRMDPVTLREHLEKSRVFCALSALGKRSILLAQKEAGHTTLACTHSSSDTLSQEAADVNVVCVRDRKEALLQNADIILTAERFELLPELLRLSRRVFSGSLRILRFCLVLIFALFSTAGFSLFFRDVSSLVQPLAVLLLGLVFFLVASVTLGRDKKLVTSLTPIEKDSFLHEKVSDLVIYGACVGVTTGISTALSYLCSTWFCHPAEASSVALISLYLCALFALFSARKTERITKPEFHFNPMLFFCILTTLALLAILLLLPNVRLHLGLLLPPLFALPIAFVFSLLPLVSSEGYKTVKERLARKK
ncbi:MAG: cation-transporting P-type ATPase [Clostridia bacterium]|nr:cation-transporting P-type ATPase [Clostridia bacterium]